MVHPIHHYGKRGKPEVQQPYIGEPEEPGGTLV
jgi:hypothetical protein